MKNLKILTSSIFVVGALFFLFQNCSPYELSKLNQDNSLNPSSTGGKLNDSGGNNTGSNSGGDPNNGNTSGGYQGDDSGNTSGEYQEDNDPGGSETTDDGNSNSSGSDLVTKNGNYSFKSTNLLRGTGFYYQLLKDNEVVSVAYMDWYINGVKEEHGGSITLYHDELYKLQTCTFKLKAVHMTKGGDFIGSAEQTMYVPNCAYDKSNIPRGSANAENSCSNNVNDKRQWSSFFSKSFPESSQTDFEFLGDQVISVSFTANFNGKDGAYFLPYIKPQLNGQNSNAAKVWEIEISKCAAAPDPSGGSCYLYFNHKNDITSPLRMVRADKKDQYPERCALVAGGQYYINLKAVASYTKDNGQRTACWYAFEENGYKCDMNPGSTSISSPFGDK